jgi:hypothetical protein
MVKKLSIRADYAYSSVEQIQAGDHFADAYPSWLDIGHQRKKCGNDGGGISDLQSSTARRRRREKKRWLTWILKDLFCATQASRDGVQYSWVDTCYIDTSDNIDFQRLLTAAILGSSYHLIVKNSGRLLSDLVNDKWLIVYDNYDVLPARTTGLSLPLNLTTTRRVMELDTVSR